jgi:hypothetical protein
MIRSIYSYTLLKSEWLVPFQPADFLQQAVLKIPLDVSYLSTSGADIVRNQVEIDWDPCIYLVASG